MSLPASEDTTTLRQGAVVIEHNTGDDHIKVLAGADINQGDFVMAWPYFGIADEDIANGAVGTIHVGQVYSVGADRTGASQTFYTDKQAVYFDTVSKKFFEASATGYALVGYVRQVGSASVATWLFEGLRIAGAIA